MPKTDLKLDNRTVVFTGGGSGGHLWPLVSLVRWTKLRYGIKPIYFGTGSKLERRIWRKENVRQITIPSGKKRNYSSWRNGFGYLWLVVGFLKALIWLISNRPALIFGKGGYGMMPTIMAARILKIPVITHESDIVMGRANRYSLEKGHLVLTAFPVDFYEADLNQRTYLRYAGMPIHPEFYQKFTESDDHKIARPKIIESQKAKVKKTILIFGGSQGATRINEIVARLWPRLAELGHIIHVTGEIGYKVIEKMHRNISAELRSKIEIHQELDDLPQAINQASFIIARAGSTSLWEIVTSQTSAIVIPLPESAADHQRLNALWFSQEFPFITMIEEKDINDDDLVNRIKRKMAQDKTEITSLSVMPDLALIATGEAIYEGLVKNYLSRPHHFHLVGAQGVSMRGIAEILKRSDQKITGSDVSTGGHSALNIAGDIDAVIYSSAVSGADSPGQVELKVANDKNIPVIKRSRFMRDLANINRLIAVSGMHGKSTTSSMIAHIFKEMKIDPSYLIGVPDTVSANDFVGGANKGSDNLFIVEACEYDRSFYDLPADVAVVTNIEPEHLDYFKGGLKEIESSFIEFLSILRPGATVIAPDHDEPSERVLTSAQKIRPDLSIIKIAYNAAKVAKINPRDYQIFGEHNFYNAALSVEAAFHFGIRRDDAWRELQSFRGAHRRLEYIGLAGEALVYDDYGHHPTEITASLTALKDKYPDRKITLVFQPHQVSRTEYLFDDFVSSLSAAHRVIITDIYKVPGREEKETVKSELLVDAINKKSNNANYIALPYDNIVEYLKGKIGRDDLVLTIGATNISEVAKGLVDGN